MFLFGFLDDKLYRAKENLVAYIDPLMKNQRADTGTNDNFFHNCTTRPTILLLRISNVMFFRISNIKVPYR